MAEVLRSFDDPIRDESGVYQARVVGRHAPDGMWEGWFEFIPKDGSEAVVSAVESRQPERDHLLYWASGLTAVYAEGALQRARRPVTVRTRIIEVPVSDAPKPRTPVVAPRAAGPEPVLDPFEIGGKSLDILAKELHAIGRARMLNIIAAYDLNPAGTDLQGFSDAQLVSFIVASVEASLMHRSR